MENRAQRLIRAKAIRRQCLKARRKGETFDARLVFNSSELGEAFRERRRELGYTQVGAARLAAHSPRAIGDIERGRNTVGIGVIMDYAAILGLDFKLEPRGDAS